MSKPERFLSRWSRRKLETLRAPVEPAPAASAPVAPVSPAPVAVAPAPDLPPVESLTFDSDFTAFLQPGVDAAVQRAALRKLLHDPRFNVMDGLDVYIDDYTKASPLEASVVKDLVSARYVLSPPLTRVNAEGVVEDVPPEETEAAKAAPEDASPDAPDAPREEAAKDAS